LFHRIRRARLQSACENQYPIAIHSGAGFVDGIVSFDIFLAGGTGYVGASLIPLLLGHGHRIRALVRTGSERKLLSGCEIVSGNALDPATFSCAGADTYVHLVGTPHPAPWKARQFRSVDLVALQASAEAARAAGVRHFIFVSVAHPAPVMRAYIEVRLECESIIRAQGLTATVLRPWYILGPGHRWPVGLLPFYALAERVPLMRPAALRLGLVTIEQMRNTLLWAVENPPVVSRVLDVEAIRLGYRCESATGTLTRVQENVYGTRGAFPPGRSR
jgi:uncharacterized protein YbjT (DUF2867 family)